MRKSLVVLIALLIALLVFLPCLAPAEGRTVTVTASATVQAEADTATVQFGVSTSAKEVAAASSANASRMEQLTLALKSAGIDEKDISTSNYYVGAIYDYSAPDENGAWPLRGYEVSSTLSVILRDVSQTGSIIDLALANGANNCGGIVFSTSKAGEIGDQALLAAIAEGRRKAGLMAEACGAALGDLQSCTEISTSGAVVINAKRAMGAEEAEMDTGTQIFADSVSFHATVQMTYLLDP